MIFLAAIGATVALLPGEPPETFAGRKFMSAAVAPSRVRQAARAALPAVRWSVAVRLEMDGKTRYRLLGYDGKGQAYSVTTTKTGKVLKVNRIKIDLPAN